jgi:hypothetical protein
MCVAPWSPRTGVLAGLAVLVLVGGVGVRLGGIALRHPANRWKSLALIGFFTAELGLVGLIGFGRGGLGPEAGTASRYAMTTLPILFGVFVVAVGDRSSSRFRALPTILMLLTAVLLPLQMNVGRRAAQKRAAVFAAFDRDLRSGLPLDAIVEHQAHFVGPEAVVLRSRMLDLKRAGVAPFDRIREMVPPFLALTIAEGHTSASIPYFVVGSLPGAKEATLDVHLPESRFLIGVRVRYRLTRSEKSPLECESTWLRESDETPRGSRLGLWPAQAGVHEHVAWIQDAVRHAHLEWRIPPGNQLLIIAVACLLPIEGDTESGR